MWDGPGEPSQEEDRPMEPADLDTHWAEHRQSADRSPTLSEGRAGSFGLSLIPRTYLQG